MEQKGEVGMWVSLGVLIWGQKERKKQGRGCTPTTYPAMPLYLFHLFFHQTMILIIVPLKLSPFLSLTLSLSLSLSLSNYPMLPSCPFSESELHMVMIDSIHSPTTFPLTILHSIFVNHKLYLEKGISAAFILLQVFTIFSFCSHLHHARVCRFRKIPTIGGKASPPSSPSLYSYEPLHLISSPSNS